MGEQEIRRILAIKLKEYRERSGLSAKEVGNAVGKSEKTINAWEHGRGQPDADMLFVLCNLYKIENINVFYGLDDVDHAEAEDEAELLKLYRGLNVEGKALVMNMIRTFAGNPTGQLSSYQSAAAIARQRANEADQKSVEDRKSEAHA